MFNGQSEEEFRQEIKDALTNMEFIGVNTVYVHAVAYTDAFYNSSIYPRTKFLPDIDYDPLKIFVEEANSKNMEVEAWVNPLRSISVEEAEELEDTFILKQWINENNERIRQVNGRYYLNPAYQEVKDLLLSVIEEILDNYDVKGIHFDDYFYPDGAQDKFDAYIYSQAIKETDISRTEFRQNCINDLVKQVSDLCKEKEVRFTISTSGNNENNLTIYYANPQAWVEQGTVDMLIPQIYWGFDHPIKPYVSTLEEFLAITDGSNTQLMAGLAAYKVGTKDSFAQAGENEWLDNTDILARETTTALQKGCVGVAYFRYGSLFKPSEEVKESVENEIIHIIEVNK